MGGDWYDALVLADGRLSISVGDVMGKGLVAAAGMGRMRSALRALAVNDPDPARVLASLDRLFTATESGDQELLLTTLVLLVVDPADWRDARLPTPATCPSCASRPTATPRCSMPAPAPPRSGCPSRAKASPWCSAPGETLLAFTDGLVEDRDRSLDEGLGQVLAAASAAASAAGRPSSEMLDAVLEARLGAAGGEDDVTLARCPTAGTPG